MDSNPANPMPMINPVNNIRPNVEDGCSKASLPCGIDAAVLALTVPVLGVAVLAVAAAARKAGRRHQAVTALNPHRPAARKNGSLGPPSAARDPMAGPATKPRAMPAPSRPNRRGRWGGGARSAAAAWATERLPPENPSSARAKMMSGMAPARPVIRCPTLLPMRAMTSTGRRP